jgi:ribose transport system ATP-binding protein
MGDVLLQMEGIDKSFPGVHALNKAQFELRAGEVHALSAKTARANRP